MRRLSLIATAVFVVLVLASCQTITPSSAPAAVTRADEQPAGRPGLQPITVRCELKLADAEYAGTCEIPCRVNQLLIDIDGPTPNRTCADPPRRVNATLKKTARVNHWLGGMQGKEPEDPTRFELLLFADGKGVAKLPYGWFALQSMTINGGAMTLTVAAEKTLPPTQDDARIIQRALALLPDDSAWNKADNRQCPAAQPKLSVFCALIRATEEISGGYHYRQPAMQAVREVVNEVGGSRVGKHRLMDYNNHPDTTLAEIHGLLRAAQTKLEQRFR